jgi:hypothetical protein
VKPAAEPKVEIRQAERISGPDGAVEKGDNPISEAEAVSRLKAGGDIVVCGPKRRANRNLARTLIELTFGEDCVEDLQHGGRMALPHFHPPRRTPEGVHAFFEAPPRHAKKKKR